MMESAWGTVRMPNGEMQNVTRLTGNGKKYLIPGWVTQAEAVQVMKRYLRSPKKIAVAEIGGENIILTRGVDRSVKAYKKFQGKLPRRMVELKIPTREPYIQLGEVPTFMYRSAKEGKMRNYVHDFNLSRLPVAYAHPTERVIVILGGTWSIDKWLRG